MGSKPKTRIIVVPATSTQDSTSTSPAQDSTVQNALPPPTPQASPSLRGSGTQRGPAALAASMGMNNTNLTGPRGLSGLSTETRRSSLLGL